MSFISRFRDNGATVKPDFGGFMLKILTLVLALGFIGCSASHKKKSKVHDLKEMQLEKEQEISGGDKVGIRDDTFKVQKKVMLVESLRDLENTAFGMEYEVYGNRVYGTKGLYGAYRDCRTEVNSIIYGGSGKMKPIEPPASVVNEDKKFKYGIDKKGDLVGVTEEFLSERIERFKKYKVKLTKRLNEYETKVRICENDLKQAKLKQNQKSQ